MTTISMVSDGSRQTQTSTRTLSLPFRTTHGLLNRGSFKLTLVSQCLCKSASLFLLYLEDPEAATLASNVENNK